MNSRTQTFYFDEAGYTGNNLLDPEQPVFVYAGVAIDNQRASQIHADARARFQINADELKGANLLRHRRGRDAISWILAECTQFSHIVVADKEYTLAGKFFEYICEPVLASQNSLFYSIEFHKFVATFLYCSYKSRDPNASAILTNFAEMMRSMDPEKLENVLSSLDNLDQSNPMGKILLFACCHRNRIEDAIRMLSESGRMGNWSLELSTTALHWLLASWGEDYEVLDVYCDDSKPLQASLSFLKHLIGREDKSYIWIGERRTPSVIYNLAEPIHLVDSKHYPGIQIADVLSSSLNHALRTPNEKISREWLKITEDAIIYNIYPESRQIDLKQECAFINNIVLEELLNRSLMGQDLFQDMSSFISHIKALYPEYVRDVVENISMET